MAASKTRSRRTRRGSRHEVRTWLGKDLFDRLSREAAARELNLSQCVRDLLREHFELQLEAAEVLAGRRPGDRSPQSSPVCALLEATEARISALLAECRAEVGDVESEVRLVASMVQQAYLGVLSRLPPFSSQERESLIESVQRSHKSWEESVATVFQEGGPRLLQVVYRREKET